MINGPTHEVFKKKLTDTLQDYLTTDKRQYLRGTCGVNQRGFDFFLGDTFLVSNFYQLKQIKKL